MFVADEGGTMNPFEVLIDELDRLTAEYGESTFRYALELRNRRRLENRRRTPRKRFAWSKYQKLYRKQRGICPLCRKEMVLLNGEVEIDHKDPNRASGFNDDDNLQLTHRRCNRSKSSRSVYKQSKQLGRNMAEFLDTRQ
jgi:5-methylcytosine-specific restriction endonuclease McrA